MTFTNTSLTRTLEFMSQSAAVLCQDHRSLQILGKTLEQLGMDLTNCRSQRHALETVMGGHCSSLIADFDLPGAEEVIRMASLLPEPQKPVLVAIASRAWPGTGEAFQSGAGRILYKPLDPELVKQSLKAVRKSAGSNRRKSARYEAKTLVYLEPESGTLPAVSIDIGEHGLALQASDPVPMSSDLPFRCLLPGTDVTLQGHADVIWASDQGRAGLFFSKLTPAARKHLKAWLAKRGRDKNDVRGLLPTAQDHVSFAAPEEEVETV